MKPTDEEEKMAEEKKVRVMHFPRLNDVNKKCLIILSVLKFIDNYFNCFKVYSKAAISSN